MSDAGCDRGMPTAVRPSDADRGATVECRLGGTLRFERVLRGRHHESHASMRSTVDRWLSRRAFDRLCVISDGASFAWANASEGWSLGYV